MGIEAKRQYLERVRLRYLGASKKTKGRILDELCAVCDYGRKYAIRVLNRAHKPYRRKPGPLPIYDDKMAKVLSHLWFEMEQINSKKMVCAMSEWLEYYEGPVIGPEIRQKLLSVSASSIDRLLRPWRDKFKPKGLCSTRPGSLLKNRIPIQPVDWNIKEPGFMEADTVAHCGDSLSGSFANSITMTDLDSTWTENRAVWTKGSRQVIDAIKDIEKYLPFPILGFDCDNGTEFLNYNLINYFQLNRRLKVKFTRSRPYRKNDNCHVEQKNWTHVRRLFGYDRIESEELVDLMNDIYKNCWNPLYNFFIPTIKLVRKERIGAKIKKTYDIPKTPYQRILDSASMSETAKQALREQKITLNPFHLKRDLKEKFAQFELALNRLKRTSEAA